MKSSRLLLTLGLAASLLLTALGAPVLAQGQTGPGLVVFASNRSGNYEIYVLDPATGLTTQLTNNPANDIDPQWSPDGTQIAFASDRDGDYELYVMKPDGSDVKQLTNNQAQDVLPRWQPDGTNIVYVSDVNGQWDLYDIDANTGIVRQLTNDPADERGPLVAQGGGVVGPGAVPPAVVTPIPTQALLPDGVVNSGQLNVRANPGTGAQILTSVPRDTPLTILGRYSDNSWLQVETPNGVTGWVFTELVTVNINLANVPVVSAQFIAPPPTSTPTPAATALPASGANLVAGVVVFNPSQPTCQQTFTVGFDVANLGTQPTAVSGTVSLVDTRAADGSQQGNTIGGFPILQPGQTFRVNMPLTISTWYNEQHNITLVIDPGHQVPETTTSDNVRTVSYTLAKGGCP
jgi:uncharacterized protein YgiM (DUF1202 family)